MSNLFGPEVYQKFARNDWRQPNRPLTAFSDYVVDQLPNQLEDWNGGFLSPGQLSVNVERAISSTPRFEQVPALDRAVARLDIQTAYNAVVHTHATPLPDLIDRAESAASLTGQPLCLTYEDVVLNNPSCDIRTLTLGHIVFT